MDFDRCRCQNDGRRAIFLVSVFDRVHGRLLRVVAAAVAVQGMIESNILRQFCARVSTTVIVMSNE